MERNFSKSDAPELAEWILLKAKSARATLHVVIEDGKIKIEVEQIGSLPGQSGVVALLIALVEGIWRENKLG